MLYRGGPSWRPHDGFPDRDKKLPGHGPAGAAAAASGGSLPARVQQPKGREDHLQQQPEYVCGRILECGPTAEDTLEQVWG